MRFRYNRKGFKLPRVKATPRKASALSNPVGGAKYSSATVETFQTAAVFTMAIAAMITFVSISSRRRERRHDQDSQMAQLQTENNLWRSWWNEKGRYGTATESSVVSELRKENEEVKKDLRELLAWIEGREREGVWKGQ